MEQSIDAVVDLNNNTERVIVANNDDDIWGEEEFKIDGQSNSTTNYDNFVADLNYNRMRETFVTLGIKEGVSEGLDEARQVYFEKGLVGGIREGIVCGFIIHQLLLNQEEMSEERRNLMKTSCVQWKKEKMDQVMNLILPAVQTSSSSTAEQQQQPEAAVEKDDGEDEDLRMIRNAIEKHPKQVEMFRESYGSILRY